MEVKRTQMQFVAPVIEEVVHPRAFSVLVYRNRPINFGDALQLVHYRDQRGIVPLVQAAVKSGRDFRREWRLDIGRAEDNDIVLESELVSAYHGSFVACLLRGEPALFYVDRGSTNGSFLNGRQVCGVTQCVPGSDVISVGGLYEEAKKFEYDVFVQRE